MIATRAGNSYGYWAGALMFFLNVVFLFIAVYVAYDTRSWLWYVIAFFSFINIIYDFLKYKEGGWGNIDT